VLDLGEKSLKDIQHERLYEVSVDGAARGYHAEPEPRPRRASRGDELAERFEQRIEDYVHRQLERALGGVERGEEPKPPELPVRLALSGLGIAFASLLTLALTVVVIVVLVKLVF
jgi:hypothetical protein